MKHLYTSTELRLEIMTLEADRLRQEEDLRNTASAAIHSLSPLNLLKKTFNSTFNSTVKSPGFGNNMLKGLAGLAAGILSKRLFVMGSSSIVKKALGTVVELGVAKAVSSNVDKIKAPALKIIGKALK